MTRKKPEPRPPAPYLRSRPSGTPAEVIRTSRRNEYGRWIYKLWYGDVIGNGRYTLAELLLWNARWCQTKPADLKSRVAAKREEKP